MISITNVKKRFGPVLALDGVNLQIRPGERVAFVGPNGSGKTTLLRALLGLVRVEGAVSIDGIDVARAPAQALLGVAYIPQIAPPLETTVGELVNAHSALRGLQNNGIHERAKRLGLDVGAVAHARFRDLSGGMKQKLLAAMALASDSRILVCDEPTANLDANARAGLFEQVAERAETDIVVLCSHRVDEVQKLVGRVVEFGEGRVVRDAPLGEVLSGLRAFRIDVEVRPGATAAVAALHARGFQGTNDGWLGADVLHAEKMEFVSQVLPQHHESIVDVSIVPTAHLSLAVRRGPFAASGDPAQ